MAQAMNTRARAIAIAAAGAVALGGVQIAAPTDSVLAAGVSAANAQETDQNAKPGIQATDAKYVGVFSKDGEKITGTLTSGNAQKGTPLTSETGAIMRTSINLANAAPGDRINVKPQTTFSFPNGQEITNSHAGLRIPTTVEARGLEYDGQIIGTWRYVQSGALEIVFNDNIADVTEGTLNIDVPIMVWSQWTDYKAFDVNDGEWDGRQLTAETSGSPVIVVDAVQKQGGKKTTNTLRTNQNVIFNVIAQNSIRDMFRHYESGSVVTNTEDLTVSAKGDTIEFPAGANGTVTTKPDTTRDDTADWTYATNLKFEPRFREYGKRGADNEHTTIGESMSLEEAQAKYPGINANASIKNGTITATTANVPENVKVTFRITPGEGETAVKYATYLENGLLRTEEKFQGTINGEETTFNGATHALTRIVRIPGAPSLDGVQTLNWTAALDGAIQGQPDGAGKNGNTAQIGGTKQTFQFFVKNNGNAYLAAPLVTLPDGKRVPVKGVGIKPGEEGSFSVDYNVPAGSGVLNFEVSMGKADFQPTNKVSFRYSNASQSDSVPGSFGYPTDKPVSVKQDQTVKSPAPKDAPKDTKYRIDRTTNPNLTWATVDPNTGVVTLSPSANVVPGNYEVPVEATFPDGSKRTINLPVLVTGVNPADRVKDLENEVADLEKQLEEEKKKSNADREKIAKLEAELKAAKDALKVAQDAAKAAQDTANNAQNTANQALADLAKERGRIDDLNKDLATERARVDDLTKRADKAEKDLADARKRVDALEKENKAQQGQIDQARKDITALQTEADRLGKELEAAKKRVATLEKENKEQAAAIDALKKQNADQQGQIDALKKENATQQKQINTLRADLTKAEKRISTLETQLRETQTELAAVSARLGVVEGRLNTGLGKCIDTLGGGLLAIVPIIAVLATAANHVQMPGVQAQLTQAQKQMGVYNPQLADFMYNNAGALVAGAGAIATLGMLLAPNTCRDNTSVGGAIGENLSSSRVTDKAAQTEEAQAEDAKEKVAAK